MTHRIIQGMQAEITFHISKRKKNNHPHQIMKIRMVYLPCICFSYCTTTSLPLCPDCSLVECVPKIEASDCPEGTHWEDNIIWGCCPACTRRIEVGKSWIVYHVIFHFFFFNSMQCTNTSLKCRPNHLHRFYVWIYEWR